MFMDIGGYTLGKRIISIQIRVMASYVNKKWLVSLSIK